MSLGFEMGFENMLDRSADISPEKMGNQQEGDIYRSCLADDYRQNMPQVECAQFAPVQFKALTITCGVLLVLSVAVFARELYKKRPGLRANKVAVAGPGKVAEQQGQSEQSSRGAAPSGTVITPIEVVDKREGHTPNVQSKVDVATPMKLFNKRNDQKLERKIELPLNTIAGPSGIILRPDQSTQSRCNNTGPYEKAFEIGFFHQKRKKRHFECAVKSFMASLISHRKAIVNNHNKKVFSFPRPTS